MANWLYVRRWLATLLVFVALGVIAHTLAREQQVLAASALRLPWFSYVLALAALMIMNLIKGIMHARILNQFAVQPVGFRLVLDAYAKSQVLRYVPGKVLGIYVQGELLAEVATRRAVWLAHVWQTAVTNFNGVLIIIVIYLSLSAGWLYLALMPLALLISTLFLKEGYRLGCSLVSLLLPWVRSMLIASPGPLRLDRVQLLLLQLEWLAYYAAWCVLLLSDLTVFRVISLATGYAAASLLGLVFFVVPSGWFIREAIFLQIARGGAEPAGLLVFVAAVLRVLTILSDILGALLCTLVLRWSSTHASQRRTG